MYLGRYIRYLKYIQYDFLNVFLCPHRGAELLALSLREALEHSKEDEKKCLRVITRQLCWFFFLHPGSMALAKEMPSYHLFLCYRLLSLSFFLLFLNFSKKKSLRPEMRHCSAYGALTSRECGSISGWRWQKLQADSSNLKTKAGLLSVMRT